MKWQPTTLTRAQLEERRLEGGRLLRKGQLSKAEIARQLGVSRATVTTWDQQLHSGGLQHLRRRLSSGRPPKLTQLQQQGLLKRLSAGARAAGFPTDRWTLPRVRQVIVRDFAVSYHVKYLNRLLHKLGWTPQVPLPRARERDDQLIQAWLAHDWPRIKKSAPPRH